MKHQPVRITSAGVLDFLRKCLRYAVDIHYSQRLYYG